MNTVCSTFLASIVLFAPAALSAQTVYQNTNEQGVVEFSDQPSEGASTRTVNPNVVDISSTPQSSTSQQPAKQQAAATPAPAPATNLPTVTSGFLTKACSSKLFSAKNFLMRPPIIFSTISGGLPDSAAWAV